MSIASSYAAMSNADTTRQQENRLLKQQEYTERQSGFTRDGSGNLVATDLRAAQEGSQKSQLEIMQEQLNAQQQTLAAQQATFNANGITNILASIVEGNWKDAYGTWNRTTGLKEALRAAPTLDINEISPVNFSDPNDLAQLKSMGIDTSKVQDPEVQDALLSSIMKVQGKDGSWRVVPVDAAIKQTNSYSMFTSAQEKMYNERSQKINGTVKGLSASAMATQETTEKIAASGAEKQLKDMQAFFESNPNATYADWQANLAKADPKTQMDLIKTGAEITKIGAQTEQAKANTKKALAQAKAALVNPSNQKRDSLKQLEDAIAMLEDPNTPPEKRDALISWIDKQSTSASYATQERSLGDLSTERKRASEIVKSYDGKPEALQKAKNIQDQILADLSETEKAKVKKTEALVETNYNTAAGVDRILTKYLSGDTKDTVDADVISSAKTWVNKNLGREEAEALKKVKFDTAAGMLLAGYIKELSGTAASDSEVQRLTNIFLAGKYTDETYIKASMEEFRDSLREKNKTLLTNYEDTLPHTILAYTKDKPGSKVDLNKFVTGGTKPVDLNQFRR